MEIQKNQPFSDYLWIKPADSEAKYFWQPKSIEELSEFNYLYKKILVVGGGSNMVVGKFDGLVIRTNNLNQISFEEECIIVEAGTLNKILVIKSIKRGIGGFEFLYTIPGTIGGSVFMNAGAHGHSISEFIEWVEIIDYNNKKYRFKKEEIEFRYRSSSIPTECIITRVALKFNQINQNKSRLIIKEIDKYVNTVQPRSLTAGSTFKNPEGTSAWKLIAELSPEELRSKNCHFSQQHKNFLINDGNATARELEELASSVQSNVYQKTGTMLEFEVKFFLD